MRENYMVKIDPEASKNWIKKNGLTAIGLSRDIGKSPNYLSGVVMRGAIHKQTLQILELKFNLDPEEIMCKDTQDRKEPNVGFSMGLDVKPDRVRVSVLHNGEEMYSAFAWITGDTELKLMQAISYAAHLCYKMAEQKELRKG